jgi:pyruvate dehydrogenase E2 component (dihydrolipoamide acetyltransferase)
VATSVSIGQQEGVSADFIITSWHKAEGDTVEKGELLFTYETDKAAVDEASPVTGRIRKIYFEEGAVVRFEETVCDIDDDDLYGQPDGTEDIISDAKEARVLISPRAKRLAKELGLDYRLAVPTGSKGNIVEQDILALKERRNSREVLPASVGSYEVLSLSPVRQSIGAAMVQSAAAAAQVTLHRSFNAESLLACQNYLNNSPAPEGNKITLNDLIVFAVSRTIKNYKELNANFIGGKIYAFEEVNLGIAVDSESGVLVPTLFKAESKSIRVISKELKELIRRSRNGSIQPQECRNAGFTISNLGSLGIEYFTPIINPPQTGILGVNTISYKNRPGGGGAVPYPAIGLSLTFDHRVLDGGRGARFLKDLADWLVNIEEKLG